MSKPNKKQKSFVQEHATLLLALVAALLVSTIFLISAQYFANRSSDKTEIPDIKSTPAHIDGESATEQVDNFYRQYINPNTTSDFRKVLIEGYGSKNLVFYSQYYQHGFDPITCSTFMPENVTSSLVLTGPVAFVNAAATFADGTHQTIETTVVLGDKLAIDSITCPGDKGNLPPAVR